MKDYPEEDRYNRTSAKVESSQQCRDGDTKCYTQQEENFSRIINQEA